MQSIAKSSKLSSDFFYPKLLNETQLFIINDFYAEEEEEEWSEDETNITGLSFEEFTQTLN